MGLKQIFTTYIHYLIHPFKTHEQFMFPDRFENKLESYSAYQSLSISWVFIVINGLARIVLLNFVLVLLINIIKTTELHSLIDLSSISGLHLIILSSVLDVIFFPLFGFFIIQFWEVIIRMVGSVLEVPGDLADKADKIVSVYLSANIFRIIPILGGPIKNLAGMILLYAGLRSQFNASPVLSICVIFTPYLFIIMFISVLTLMFLLSI